MLHAQQLIPNGSVARRYEFPPQCPDLALAGGAERDGATAEAAIEAIVARIRAIDGAGAAGQQAAMTDAMEAAGSTRIRKWWMNSRGASVMVFQRPGSSMR
jgi:hypothetical protein